MNTHHCPEALLSRRFRRMLRNFMITSWHAGVGIAGETRDRMLGQRLTPEDGSATDLSFGVRATRRESNDTIPENIVGFEASLRW